MTLRAGRSIASALVILLISLPAAALAKERRGADVDVVRRNGLRTGGELIAVTQDALVLLNPSGRDQSIPFAAISSITINKKSRATKGPLTGFLIGSIAGGVAGAAVKNDEQKTILIISGAFLFGMVGAFIGLAIGSAGSEETIDFERLPEPEAQKVKTRLRGMARMPAAQ